MPSSFGTVTGTGKPAQWQAKLREAAFSQSLIPAMPSPSSPSRKGSKVSGSELVGYGIPYSSQLDPINANRMRRLNYVGSGEIPSGVILGIDGCGAVAVKCLLTKVLAEGGR